MDGKFHNSIVKTLAYFDYFDHPLTATELYCFLFLPQHASYADFIRELDKLEYKSSSIGFERFNGFYFLRGRQDCVDIRRAKTVDNDRKNHLASKAVRKLRYAPFVRAVFICNNTALEMARPNSDIDVVIIIKSGRLWIGRLLVTLILSVFRLRRTRHKITNRICLSFYATDKALDFSNLQIAKPDIGLMYWIAQFTAIYDPNDIGQEIFNRNQWIRGYLPNALQINTMSGRFYTRDNWLSRVWKKFWEMAWGGTYGDLVENQARLIQKAKMKRNLHSVQNEPDTRVVISDEILKFHENDRRLEYKEKWEAKVKEYLFN
ncbi:MAG: hypothetical protein COU31_04985 [Candidatus Magasanikbacteria bacterium CG10_big_fil_rev_8_21_14_0_10_40_10]|uniref:Polymerase nucleotidyl transferase domain-containing protein n=1 Tax=Candidatus Magasanikbacteria bacterium CG10_big_fil_rev_8_21_14_0_10_40_10 TaxID=1974648 RepID=A0A2M6W2S3_9BACT|nr:MAG: hypothetical protein COU31_04985 [Candidatus Magasanikbacteria bacterium CG10_big_fil_rev_8_21_14_0_10_40_10]